MRWFGNCSPRVCSDSWVLSSLASAGGRKRRSGRVSSGIWRARHHPPPVERHSARGRRCELPAAPKKYPDELRERAVRLFRESDPKPVIRRLAEQLNVHPEALRNWIRQDEADRGQRHDRPTTDMSRRIGGFGRESAELRRVNDVLRAASAYFAAEIDPPRGNVMSFVDADEFPVDLVLRVLSIPASTYCDWRTRQAAPSRRLLEDARAVGDDRQDPRFARVRRHVRLPAGVASAASPGVRCGGKRVERITRANRRRARLAQGVERWLDQAEPASHRGTRPGRPGLHGHRPEPAVGGRPDPDPDRRGGAVAGQRVGMRSPTRSSGWAAAPARTLIWYFSLWTTPCAPVMSMMDS